MILFYSIRYSSLLFNTQTHIWLCLGYSAFQIITTGHLWGNATGCNLVKQKHTHSAQTIKLLLSINEEKAGAVLCQTQVRNFLFYHCFFGWMGGNGWWRRKVCSLNRSDLLNVKLNET